MKYTANKNEVLIWIGMTEEPNIVQPHWPDGTPWASDEDAKAWAEAYIESAENPESEFLPGNSPDQPLIPRPLPESLEGEIVDEATE